MTQQEESCGEMALEHCAQCSEFITFGIYDVCGKKKYRCVMIKAEKKCLRFRARFHS